MQIGLLGLGKMGRRIADKLLSEGHEVVVWNRSKEVLEEFKIDKATYIVQQKLQIVHAFEQLRDVLLKPRVFWSMLPAGEATQNVMSQLTDIAEGGDIVIDGGNAHFSDTEKLFTDFSAKGIKFLG